MEIAQEVFIHLFDRDANRTRGAPDADVPDTSSDRMAIISTYCSHQKQVRACVARGLHPVFRLETLTAQGLREKPVLKAMKDIGHKLDHSIPKVLNPSMEQLVRAALEMLHQRNPAKTHVFVLSPRYTDFRKLVEEDQDIQVHQVNPVESAYRVAGTSCPSYERATTTNFEAYVSLLKHVKQLIGYTRYEKPLGQVSDIVVEIVPQPGCTLLVPREPVRLSSLQLGQQRSLFVNINVDLKSVKSKDLCTTKVRYKTSVLFLAGEVSFSKVFSMIAKTDEMQDTGHVELIKRMVCYYARTRDPKTAQDKIVGTIQSHEGDTAFKDVCNAALKELDFQTQGPVL